MTLSTLADPSGRALPPGSSGPPAMTVSSTIETRLRGRAASSAPARAAAKVLGIERFQSDAAEQRFSTPVHWGYGTGWGAVRGLLGATGLPAGAAAAAHLAGLWGSEVATLRGLDVAPPITLWGVDFCPRGRGGSSIRSAVAVGVWTFARAGAGDRPFAQRWRPAFLDEIAIDGGHPPDVRAGGRPCLRAARRATLALKATAGAPQPRPRSSVESGDDGQSGDRGGSGIGAATAAALAARGDRVVCADVNLDAARRTAGELAGASAVGA